MEFRGARVEQREREHAKIGEKDKAKQTRWLQAGRRFHGKISGKKKRNADECHAEPLSQEEPCFKRRATAKAPTKSASKQRHTIIATGTFSVVGKWLNQPISMMTVPAAPSETKKSSVGARRPRSGPHSAGRDKRKGREDYPRP